MQINIPIKYKAGLDKSDMIDTTVVDIQEESRDNARTVAVWKPCTKNEIQYKQIGNRLYYNPWCIRQNIRHKKETSKRITVEHIEELSHYTQSLEPGATHARHDHIASTATFFSSMPHQNNLWPAKAATGRDRPFEAQAAIRVAQKAAQHMRIIDNALWIETIGPILNIKHDRIGRLYYHMIDVHTPEDACSYQGTSALDHDAIFRHIYDQDICDRIHSEIDQLTILDENALNPLAVINYMTEKFARHLVDSLRNSRLKESDETHKLYIDMRMELEKRAISRGWEVSPFQTSFLWCDTTSEHPFYLMEMIQQMRELKMDREVRKYKHIGEYGWYMLHDHIWSQSPLLAIPELDNLSFG